MIDQETKTNCAKYVAGIMERSGENLEDWWGVLAQPTHPDPKQRVIDVNIFDSEIFGKPGESGLRATGYPLDPDLKEQNYLNFFPIDVAPYKVYVTSDSGTWVNSDGTTITTVWTSKGWLDLPGLYEFVARSEDDSEEDGLTMTIMYQGEQIRVNHADFEFEE